MDLEDELLVIHLGPRLRRGATTPGGIRGDGYLDPEHGALLGHDLERVLPRDHLKDVLCVLNHDSPDTHAAGARAAHDLDLGAVEVGARELGGGGGPAEAQVSVAEHLARVAQPQRAQRLKGGVPAPGVGTSGRVVQAQAPPLARRQRRWLDGAAAVPVLLGAGAAAGLAGVGGGRGRVGAQAQRPVLDLFAVDAVDGRRRVRPGQERPRHGLCAGRG
ncbi:hypothetical protein RB597_007104 [Gaeumannomyces tritici]